MSTDSAQGLCYIICRWAPNYEWLFTQSCNQSDVTQCFWANISAKTAPKIMTLVPFFLVRRDGSSELIFAELRPI